MAKVIEHFFCSECQAEFTMRDGDPRTLCDTCGKLWDIAETFSNEDLRDALHAAEDELAVWQEDPYIGPLTKEDQQAYDDLCLWHTILKTEERSRDDLLCSTCGLDLGYEFMDDMCADCFWDYEKERKMMRRVVATTQ